MAKTNPKLAILEPTTLPKERSGKPSKAAFMLTMSSGAEVAKDTTVIPITILGINMRKDKATADFNNQFPPAISSVNPKTIKSRFPKKVNFRIKIMQDLLNKEGSFKNKNYKNS